MMHLLEAYGPLHNDQLRDKGYAVPYEKNQLKANEGLVYRFDELHHAMLITIRTKVVLPTLRQVVVSTCQFFNLQDPTESTGPTTG